MVLAQAAGERPDELRADFQQLYGLNLDGMGDSYSVPHAACLCAQLPPESRTMRAFMTPELEEAAQWTLPVRIAAAQLNALNVIRWLNTQDGVDGVNYPELLLPPEARGHEPQAPDGAGYKAVLAEVRARIRESNESGEQCLAL